jgi:hypothetical protein
MTPNYNDYYISVDLEVPTVVEALLWANVGDGSHDATSALLYLSDDAVSWTQVIFVNFIFMFVCVCVCV